MVCAIHNDFVAFHCNTPPVCIRACICPGAGDGSQHRHQPTNKYVPSYYKHSTEHCDEEDDTALEDKVQQLQQQTLAMQAQWEKQEAAAHACTPQALFHYCLHRLAWSNLFTTLQAQCTAAHHHQAKCCRQPGVKCRRLSPELK